MTFVDITKAFDTLSRDGVWKTMSKFCCPSRFIAVMRQFHDDMQACVQNDGKFYEPHEVTNGIKTGLLFRMLFPAMLTDAFQSGTALMAIYSTLES